ncbi:metallophosphoesterase [Nocardioides humi]|uniref:metallophosphoesterase n=1 Tax=Nocardioides humi TaxID=449461 RepID=UPI00112B54B3|nr:metallophosphoesterase [Nocardioides humi]
MTRSTARQSVPTSLPVRRPGTALRILATNDLLATFEPLATTYGRTGCIPYLEQLLDRERLDGPVLWLDGGDLSGGAARGLLRDDWPPAFADVPIAAAAAGNHEFDDPGLLPDLGRVLAFPVLCADRGTELPRAPCSAPPPAVSASSGSATLPPSCSATHLNVAPTGCRPLRSRRRH